MKSFMKSILDEIIISSFFLKKRMQLDLNVQCVLILLINDVKENPSIQSKLLFQKAYEHLTLSFAT